MTTGPGQAGAEAADGRLRILMVEDHPDSAKVLERLLRAGGYLPHVVGSVRDAIAAASDGMRFDLLLSDLSLPDGTGGGVLRAMRGIPAHAEVPAIALTGHGMPDDDSHTEAAGFAAHLTKPIDLNQLRAVIDRIVGEKRLRNR